MIKNKDLYKNDLNDIVFSIVFFKSSLTQHDVRLCSEKHWVLHFP